MLGTIIGLILLCIVCGVVLWAIQQFLGLIPLAEPFATAVRVLMILIVVIIAIYFIVTLLGFAGIHVSWPKGFG